MNNPISRGDTLAQQSSKVQSEFQEDFFPFETNLKVDLEELAKQRAETSKHADQSTKDLETYLLLFEILYKADPEVFNKTFKVILERIRNETKFLKDIDEFTLRKLLKVNHEVLDLGKC